MDSADNRQGEVTRLVGETFSDWTAPIEALCDDIAHLPVVDPTRAVPLHGDVHLGNFFPLTDGRLGVIDFESFRRGDPAEDLCSYFAFTQWIRMKENRMSNAPLDRFDALIEHYNGNSPTPIPRARAYKTLAQLLVFERIRRGIKRGKISGVADLTAFFTLAEQCVREAKLSRHG